MLFKIKNTSSVLELRVCHSPQPVYEQPSCKKDLAFAAAHLSKNLLRHEKEQCVVCQPHTAS